MKLVKLNKRPLCSGRKFTYVLRYTENGKLLVIRTGEKLNGSVPRRKKSLEWVTLSQVP